MQAYGRAGPPPRVSRIIDPVGVIEVQGYVDQALGYYGRAIQTAPIADQGQAVTEEVKEPPLTLIQNEITKLSPVFPQQSAAVQQIWPRLPGLAGGAPAPR